MLSTVIGEVLIEEVDVIEVPDVVERGLVVIDSVVVDNVTVLVLAYGSRLHRLRDSSNKYPSLQVNIFASHRKPIRLHKKYCLGLAVLTNIPTFRHWNSHICR